MVFIAFVASLILTIVCHLKKRQLGTQGGRGFWFHFVDKSLEFLLPFTVISGLFCLLSLFINGTSDRLTLQYLRWFENRLRWLKSFSALFKLSAFGTSIVLIVIYLLSLTRIPSQHTARMLPYLKKYKTTIKSVYITIVIVFSFTFFGVQSDQPAAELRFRIRDNEKLYGELRKEVEATLRKGVTDKLYTKIYHSFDRDYRNDMRRGDDGPPPPDGDPLGGNGGGGGGGDDDKGGGGGKGPLVYDLFDNPDDHGPDASPPAPDNASTTALNKAFEALRRYRSSFQTRFTDLLASDAGRELALQPPQMLTDNLKSHALKAMFENHPIMEPVIGKLIEVLHKTLEPLIQRGADKITGGSVRDPESTRQAITIEVSAIVRETPVTPGYIISDKLSKARAVIAEKWRGFTQAIARPEIKQTDEELARINEQIHLLTCPSEANRLLAARALAAGGSRLTKVQVQQIKEVLKLDKWRIGFSPIHEALFVEVPVKYYAALALEGMRSRYVLSEDRVAAAEIIYNVETGPPSKQYTEDEVANRIVV